MNKPINLLLAEIRGGLPCRAASDLLDDAIKASQASGKKSSITITLNIEPHGKDNRELHISMKSAAKLPVAPDLQEPSIYYSVRGQLTKNDPDQGELGIRAVGDTPADGGAPADERESRPAFRG